VSDFAIENYTKSKARIQNESYYTTSYTSSETLQKVPTGDQLVEGGGEIVTVVYFSSDLIQWMITTNLFCIVDISTQISLYLSTTLRCHSKIFSTMKSYPSINSLITDFTFLAHQSPISSLLCLMQLPCPYCQKQYN